MNKVKGNALAWVIILVLVSAVALLILVKRQPITPITNNVPTNSTNTTVEGSKFEVTSAKLDEPIQHIFKDNPNGASLLQYDKLVFSNPATGERKEFGLYDLLSENTIEPYKSMPYDVQYSLRLFELKYDSENINYYGVVTIIPGADPPVNEAATLFKINTQNWRIDKYPLPMKNYIRDIAPEALNTNMGALLIEVASRDNQLYLYSFSYASGKENLIRVYDKNTFEKYLPGEYGFLSYFHPWFGNVESRALNAKWLNNNSLSYNDFVTKKQETVIFE